MNIGQLKHLAEKTIREKPSLRQAVVDEYEIALEEIKAGESENHECKLAWNEINQIRTNAGLKELF